MGRMVELGDSSSGLFGLFGRWSVGIDANNSLGRSLGGDLLGVGHGVWGVWWKRLVDSWDRRGSSLLRCRLIRGR